MKPPRAGATTGAASAGQVIRAIACSSSDFWVLRRTTRRPTGVMRAPPTPCTARASPNSVRLPARPQHSEASVNTAIADVNTLRDPNRSASQPLSGMNAAADIR
jgi:hypothetical protein